MPSESQMQHLPLRKLEKRMTIPSLHDDVMAELPPDRRERILARARDLLAEEESPPQDAS